LEQLRVVNEEIGTASSTLGSPNELLDQRDQLINSIAERIDVNQFAAANSSSLSLGNYSIQSYSASVSFRVEQSSQDGTVSIVFGNDNKELQFSSGRLRALVDAYNQTIPGYRQQIDELASGLIRNFDQVHATGVGVAGSFEQLTGTRSVNFPNVPLVDSGISFTPEEGRLFISVVDPNGDRITQSVDIDPDSQSLTDIANAISSLDHIDANVNPQTNLLQINSSTTGYEFDFTGAVQTFPDLANVTGTAVPRLEGIYDGEENTILSFEISGSGDVGISEDLDLLVRDENGDLLQTINVGKGYESGTPIKLSNGVSIEVSAGTFNDGDTFQSDLIANPDEGGFLSALGINSFFVGVDATTIGVDQRIIDDSSLFAGSQTGESAESNKINEFVALSVEKLFGDGRQDFGQYLVDFVTQVGVNVQSADRATTNLGVLKSEYETRQNGISGVDVNEEFVRLNQLQNSFEAAVRVIQASEAIVDELFRIVR
jgi:flagellar hook-associated protein FlgK